MDDKLKKRLHIIAVTAIVVNSDGKFLIMQRSPHEVAFPSKWTVPGGKLTTDDYVGKPPTVGSYQGWYGVVVPAIQREVMEEAGIEIDNVRHLTDYTFVRPDGIPVLGLSYWATHKGGEVKMSNEMVDHAWVSVAEAKKYDLIEGIWEELRDVGEIIKRESRVS